MCDFQKSHVQNEVSFGLFGKEKMKKNDYQFCDSCVWFVASFPDAVILKNKLCFFGLKRINCNI